MFFFLTFILSFYCDAFFIVVFKKLSFFFIRSFWFYKNKIRRRTRYKLRRRHQAYEWISFGSRSFSILQIGTPYTHYSIQYIWVNRSRHRFFYFFINFVVFTCSLWQSAYTRTHVNLQLLTHALRMLYATHKFDLVVVVFFSVALADVHSWYYGRNLNKYIGAILCIYGAVCTWISWTLTERVDCACTRAHFAIVKSTETEGKVLLIKSNLWMCKNRPF